VRQLDNKDKHEIEQDPVTSALNGNNRKEVADSDMQPKGSRRAEVKEGAAPRFGGTLRRWSSFEIDGLNEDHLIAMKSECFM
jgi:hypothetical protein